LTVVATARGQRIDGGAGFATAGANAHSVFC
jgi:hypothetical protein